VFCHTYMQLGDFVCHMTAFAWYSHVRRCYSSAVHWNSS